MEIVDNKMEVVSKEIINILSDDLKRKIKEIKKIFKE